MNVRRLSTIAFATQIGMTSVFLIAAGRVAQADASTTVADPAAAPAIAAPAASDSAQPRLR